MENLVNAALATMSVQDLNQRYSQTYVKYRGQPAYVWEFRGLDDNPNREALMQYLENGRKVGKQVLEPLIPELLNIARPQAGWYFSNKDLRKAHAFYLAYPQRRQYKRGLSAKNTYLYTPYGDLLISDIVFCRALEDDTPYQPITAKVLEEKRSVIPRLDRLFSYSKERSRFEFFVRSRPVAVLEGGLLTYEERFWQELLEVSSPALLGALEKKVSNNVLRDKFLQHAKNRMMNPDVNVEFDQPDEPDNHIYAFRINNDEQLAEVLARLSSRNELEMVLNDFPEHRNVGRTVVLGSIHRVGNHGDPVFDRGSIALNYTTNFVASQLRAGAAKPGSKSRLYGVNLVRGTSPDGNEILYRVDMYITQHENNEQLSVNYYVWKD